MSIGFPDWSRPVGLIDRPQLIATEVNRSVAAGQFESGLIDVRPFTSFSMKIQYEAANAGPPANTGIVELLWTDGVAANVLYGQAYEINSINSTDCSQTQIADAMYGPFMFYRLDAGNGAGSTFDLLLYGSTRPRDTPKAQEFGDSAAAGYGIDRTLMIFNTTIAAGATVRKNCRLGSGPARLVLQTLAGGGPHDISLHSPQLGALNGRPYVNVVPAGANEVVAALTLPRRVMTLVVTNTGGAASTFRASLHVDGEA